MSYHGSAHRRPVGAVCIIVLWMAAVAAVGAPRTAAAQDLDSLYSLFRARRFEEVVRASERALAAYPADVRHHSLVGRSLVALGRSEEALPHLDSVIASEPARTWLSDWCYHDRAVALFTLGRTAEAAIALDSARASLTANAARSAAGFARVTGLDPLYGDWRAIEEAHVRVHYPPSIDDATAASFAASRERAFRVLQAEFPVSLGKRVDIFVWPGREAARRAGFPSLGFATPELGVVHSRLDQTPGHELAHVVIFSALHPVRSTRFVNEGVAVLLDLSGRDRMAVARAAAADADEPVDVLALWEDGRGAPEPLLYPVAAAFLDRLRAAGGPDRFRALLRDQTVANAREVYGPLLARTVSDFERDVNRAR